MAGNRPFSNIGEMTISGNLVEDPELRYGQSGTPWGTFNVAVNERTVSGSGAVEDTVSYFRVKAFGEMYERFAEAASRGTNVIVTGTMRQEAWKTDKGENRRTWVLHAKDIGLSTRWKKVTVENDGGSPRSAAVSDDNPFGPDAEPVSSSGHVPPPPDDDDVPF